MAAWPTANKRHNNLTSLSGHYVSEPRHHRNDMGKQIAPFISEIRNALYIGRELQKAEIEIKTPEDN